MRAKSYQPREIDPDLKYGSTKVAKLINRVMRSGKKSVAQKQVYGAFDLLKKRTDEDPLEVFEEVIIKIQPDIEVRTRRVGGASYQVPTPVRPRRAFSLAVRWLVLEANKRPNRDYHTFAEKLAAEILAARDGRGEAMNRRATSHRMAEANKAFAHFRW